MEITRGKINFVFFFSLSRGFEGQKVKRLNNSNVLPISYQFIYLDL